MFSTSLSRIAADAVVPEQLEHYVLAVSGRRAGLFGGLPAFVRGEHAVLAAFPSGADAESWRESAAALAARLEADAASGGNGEDGGPGDSPLREAAAVALAELAAAGVKQATVLAPFHPAQAPPEAVRANDCYWDIPLPPRPPEQKLRNMLKRAARDVDIREEAFGHEHRDLVNHYLQTRQLSPGSRAIFSAVGGYAQSGPGVVLLAARRADESLAAFCLGDFSGLHTAFYMFAFRREDAPPGTADALLQALARQGSDRGHSRLNLGLAINGGIGFFKRKWKAEPFLPYCETSFEIARAGARKGFFARLFS